MPSLVGAKNGRERRLSAASMDAALRESVPGTVGIAGREIHLLSHLPSHLMVAMTVGRRARENRSNHERPRHPYHANDIGQHAIVTPFSSASSRVFEKP